MRAAEADPAGKHFAMHKARYGQLFWQSGITGSPGGQQSIGSIMPAMSAGIPPRAVAGKGATTSAAIARIASNRDRSNVRIMIQDRMF